MAYKMKGHSIPGIKGFKSNSKKDGRAASSAFQMKKSPLNQEGKDKAVTLDASMDWSKIAPAVEEDISASAKEEGQGGWNYAIQEIAKAIKRKKAAKAAEEAAKTPSEKLDEKINQDITADTDDSLTGADAIKELEEETKAKHGKLPWEEGYTEEEDAHPDLVKDEKDYQAVSPGGPGVVEIKG